MCSANSDQRSEEGALQNRWMMHLECRVSNDSHWSDIDALMSDRSINLGDGQPTRSTSHYRHSIGPNSGVHRNALTFPGALSSGYKFSESSVHLVVVVPDWRKRQSPIEGRRTNVGEDVAGAKRN